ncbi:MAG: bifunctional glycosyltransferase family 2/GtrA family protein [Ignavibacteriae bacterium]|nr:bifunctional glycosyltransferase family 2/GtrA family protein [Ignavibacteriota bacterium]
MKSDQLVLNTKFTIVMPCYNEERTLEKSVARVRDIADENLKLEIIIVDDCSKDNSYNIASNLATKYSDVKVVKHEKNQGKGAALRTGFKYATGEFVAVQDADLEYDPMDLRKLLVPLINGDADVVLGSRFLSGGTHRVLYFWHSLGNKFLTMLSNMFSDLNLSDMETCYKVFKRDVIQSINIEENRFGFEPEIVAKIAQRRLRIFEMGISYYGRTYEEGKKIGAKDGFRALYCIFRYNANKAPVPIQFLFYLLIGGTAALVNLFVFLALFNSNFLIELSAPIAFVLAAAVNYYLSIKLLFRHKAKWNAPTELLMYVLLVIVAGLFDLYLTKFLLNMSFSPGISKLIATGIGFLINFLGRKYIVFPEKPSGPWKPQQMEV